MMRIACVYWWTSSVGGIATRLNSFRTAAIVQGDTWDILHCRNWKNKSPRLFPARRWISGGDTRIWVDGEIPQTEAAARWLESNYDVVFFGFLCPHQRKSYPRPEFLPVYDVRLPKVAAISDGYWQDYKDWGTICLGKVKAVVVLQSSYANVVRKDDGSAFDNVHVLPVPFVPARGNYAAREKTPLLAWTNQWKDIKGVRHFLVSVPSLPAGVRVEMYSTGIRYYQWRDTPLWVDAVGEDRFNGYHGLGRATFFGNVDLPEITKVYQRAWFTVNLQGITARKPAYMSGSYNNTEVEALFYGACPILHSSAKGTAIPPDTYLSVGMGEEIPSVVQGALDSGFALSPTRQKAARDFVVDTHLASRVYRRLRELF